jgi:hypothetical protein
VLIRGVAISVLVLLAVIAVILAWGYPAGMAFGDYMEREISVLVGGRGH